MAWHDEEQATYRAKPVFGACWRGVDATLTPTVIDERNWSPSFRSRVMEALGETVFGDPPGDTTARHGGIVAATARKLWLERSAKAEAKLKEARDENRRLRREAASGPVNDRRIVCETQGQPQGHLPDFLDP